MDPVEDIVIVGAGIAGLSTALGLHRMGLRCLVLESWDGLRATGLAFLTWMNAWKALDVLCIGDSLRQSHVQLQGTVASCTVSGADTGTFQMSFTTKGKHGDHDVRCLRRKELLEALARELPHGTIRFCSKVVSIEEAPHCKLVHLADGAILKTKVLLGCDGVNSVVATWLGLQDAVFTRRLSIRGMVSFPHCHSFDATLFQFFGDGFRSGFMPCDQKTMFWFFTFTPSAQDGQIGNEPTKMNNFVLRKLEKKVPKEFLDIIEKTSVENMVAAPLRFRRPINMLWGTICKGNVCVAGDGLHPMTPDLGQGGCAAIEDGIVLARCLSQVFLGKANIPNTEEEQNRIKKGLEKFAQERKWRSFQLMSTAYMIGTIQQGNGMLIKFLRDKVLSFYLAGLPLRRADYDCGNLISS